MSKRQFVLWCGLLVIILVFASFMSPEARAQFAPPPDAYSVTETNAMFGPAATMEIFRDGSMVLVDYQSHAATLPGGHSHLRTLYDLAAHRSFTWDLVNSAVPCGASNFSGDWGDPFAMSAELNADMSKQQAKPAGSATVNGIATKVLESETPQGKATAWLEEKYGLIVKLTMGPAGQPQTMIEVKHFSAAKPPASVFVLPPVCGEAAKAPRTPTEAERIAADTAGNAGDYANAILGPATKNSCTAVLKVVRAGSMEPITSGFQVAVDTTLDLEHPPHYVIGIGSNGRNTFSGGGLHEVTGQMRNGQLRIENLPSAFQLELTFGKAGDASALIYRQCFAPETTLLFVVKNPDKLSDGGHWLWAKPGQ